MKRLFPVLVLLAFSGCRCGDPKTDYSDGYRVGRIEKVSRKGLFIKSWEGYLVLQGFNHDDNGNPVRVTFEFSVLDRDSSAVVPVLERAQERGGLVKLHYRQDWMPCQLRHDSDYFVDSAAEVER